MLSTTGHLRWASRRAGSARWPGLPVRGCLWGICDGLNAIITSTAALTSTVTDLDRRVRDVETSMATVRQQAPHIHAVLRGHRNLAPLAAQQVTAYDTHRDGLAGNGYENAAIREAEQAALDNEDNV